MSEDMHDLEREAFSPKKDETAERLKAEIKETESKKKLIVKELLSWVEVILVSLALAWVLGNFVVMNAYIPSASMENTLTEGDRVIGSRLSYKFHEPERGDIIMFKFPDDESRDFIKRIIGLPGETVTIQGGQVYIDDSKVPLDEDYLKETPFEVDLGPFEVPEDCYFVMGDNRNNSHDSRYWDNHYVKKDEILAKAIVKWFPFNKMKWLAN